MYCMKKIIKKLFYLSIPLIMLAAISSKLYLYFGYAWVAHTIDPTPIYNSISEVGNEIASQRNNIIPKLTLMKNQMVYVLFKQHSQNNWSCFLRDKMYNFGWTLCSNLSANKIIIDISQNGS